VSESGSDANIVQMMDVVERRAKNIKPPDYWTSVAAAGWPNFVVDPTNETDVARLLQEQDHSFLFWGDSVAREFFREENTAELSPGFHVLACYVIKASADLQREMGRATTDMINFFTNNPDWTDSDYSGQNTWGNGTNFPAGGTRIQWYFPQVAGSYGAGIIYGVAEIGVRFPWPKG
jgi:hypothetical protein